MPVSALLIVSLSLVGSAVVLLLFAWLIGVRQMTNLISGYKPGSAHDEAGLTRFMGTWLAILAACMLVGAAVFPFLGSFTGIVVFAVVLTMIPVAVCGVMLAGMQRYIKPPASK